MVQLALVQRLYDELPRIPKSLQHSQCFLVDVVRAEVLRHCAIIRVR